MDPGSTALVRHVWRDRVLYAAPLTVVEDSPERTLLFLRAGTGTKWTWIDWKKGTFEAPVDHVWRGSDVLEIVRPGDAHSIWAMWSAGQQRFLCWYVNLQAPIRRVPGGLVTRDHSLDIVVAPDLRWQWKDEDHLARNQELGWMTPPEAAAVRAEGERVVERIERREPPFSEPWPEWRPASDWDLPALADDWAVVPER